MMTKYNARIPLLDTASCNATFDSLLEQSKQGRDYFKLSKQIYSIRRSEIFQGLGNFGYALGLPIPQIAAYLRQATHHVVNAFELRKTYAPYPVYQNAITNPAFNLDSLCLALACQMADDAAKLATFIYHPPGDITWHMPNDQGIAYAVRDLCANDKGAIRHIENLIPRKNDKDNEYQVQIVRGLISNSPSDFLSGLESYLWWYERASRTHSSRVEPFSCYICLRGLGYCRLAVSRNLVSEDMLPQDDPYLPLTLCGLAKDAASHKDSE